MNSRVGTAGLAAAGWVLFAALSLWLTARGGGVALDTDGALRLTEIRDLLAGQSWFDTSQHRLNTPYGLLMHWSRLADLGPALLTLALRPLGAARAENLMLQLWPLLVFLAVLMALARIAGHLAGRAAAILVLGLALLASEVWGMFSPGGIDHHNLQIALSLWTVVFLIEKRAVPAAIAVASSLTVGLETLPYALAAILVAATWLNEDSTRAFSFGAGIAAAAALFWLFVTAAAYRLTPVCDTYSAFYAALLVAGGAGLCVLGMMRRHRGMGFVLLGAGVLSLAFMINRGCFQGPYAGMSGHLKAIFLDRINEAHPVWEFISLAPSELIAGYCYAAFALLTTLFLAPSRAVLLVVLFAAIALVMASLQIREAPFAILFALPGLAAAIATYILPRGLVPAVLCLLFASDTAFALGGSFIEGEGRQAARIAAFQAQIACAAPSTMAVLGRLPPGAVAAFVDQGPAILAYTGDSAIAGPYHRDGDGIEDTYKIFTGTPEAALGILQRRHVAYLMACRAAPDWKFYTAQAPDGLLAQLERGEVPAWLKPAGEARDTLIWAVRP